MTWFNASLRFFAFALIIGHLRFLFESIRLEILQYFVESDTNKEIVKLTEDQARLYLEKWRWGDEAACPHCGGVDPCSVLVQRELDKRG